MDSEIKEIMIDTLVPFRYHSGRIYEGERLQQLMDSIKEIGLLSPIIVRPVDNGKYEIICGHNRTKAVETLGHGSIMADVRYGISDDRALELFYDSNLNQQSFSDWSYAQKFDAIRYSEQLIKKNSRQGKRTDLEKKSLMDATDETCVQNRHKSKENPRRATARDRMARRLGISTATLSKYRSIIKLPDDLLQSIARLLDEKRITFEAAYIISRKRDSDIELLLERMEGNPGLIIDIDKLRGLPNKSDEKPGVICPISKNQVLAVLTHRPSSGTISPVRKKAN